MMFQVRILVAQQTTAADSIPCSNYGYMAELALQPRV